MMNGEKVLIVSTMKNEGPYILEWVAHHIALGIDDILVFTNDCDDLTERILERLSNHAPVHQCPNPRKLLGNKGNWQVMALRYAQLFNSYRDANWIYHTDADEFLQVTAGGGSLEAFYSEAVKRAGSFHAISFTSIPFSSGDEIELRDQRTTERFTKLNKPYHQKRQAGEPLMNAIKTMFRNDVKFDLRRNHRPLKENFSSEGLVWIDGSARVMPAEFSDGTAKVMDATVSTELAQMNHYAVRCAEAFLIKMDRGDVAGTTRLEVDRKYWESYNSPGDTETQFVNLRPEAQALLEGFLADDELRRMHHDSLAIHKAKADRLKKDPRWRQAAKRLKLI